jgi:hypothetical protein
MPKMHISSGTNTFSVLPGRAVCRVRDRTDQSFPDSLVKRSFARSFGGDADVSEESKSLVCRTLSCEMPVIFPPKRIFSNLGQENPVAGLGGGHFWSDYRPRRRRIREIPDYRMAINSDLIIIK